MAEQNEQFMGGTLKEFMSFFKVPLYSIGLSALSPVWLVGSL
jgi:hypothetical protein